MLLDVGDKKYAVHFQHSADFEIDGTKPDRFNRGRAVIAHWKTHCALHEGLCKVKGCASQPHRYEGVAFCHENDQFSKYVGRKLSMARALQSMPRELRQQVWAAYFKVSPHR